MDTGLGIIQTLSNGEVRVVKFANNSKITLLMGEKLRLKDSIRNV